MGYRLRLHSEVRDWLTGLRRTEPELARRVGEAVVALLDTGECLGPPVVVPLESVFRPPDDPREAADYSYQRQLEALQKVRRGVAEVATSRKRFELQVGQFELSAAKLAQQREDALDSGDEDLAGETRTREAGVQEQLSGLREQLFVMKEKEEKLTAASQRLQGRVDAFRTRKEILKARYTADEALRSIREAFAYLGEDVSDLDLPDVEGGAEPPAVSDILDAIADLTGMPADGTWPADRGPIPAGMMELRPGAPDDAEVGLLFVAEPADTAVMVAWVEDPGGQLAEYLEVIPVAAGRLEAARSAPTSAPPATADAVGFAAYDTESFLDEFFPGAETEVEVGAAALAARSRAHALVEVRERLGVTQAQVAMRLNIRQDRVAAIERAEPGATEVRTLEAYVRALGGTLEVIASIGDERVLLR